MLAAPSDSASNCNKLEVAWRFKTDILGPRPEYKLEGTPLAINGILYTTGGTRRSVVALDAKTGELIWAHSLREGLRAATAPRQLSGRGVSYWTDGRGDDRVIYVTTGYRLVALNAKSGAVIPSFGKAGIVDLKVGMFSGIGNPIDLETGEAGLHSHRRSRRTSSSSVRLSRRDDGKSAQQHERHGSRLRRAHGPTALDVRDDATTWRAGRRDVGEGILGDQRQHRGVDGHHCR
jgi:hypothetical protein